MLIEGSKSREKNRPITLDPILYENGGLASVSYLLGSRFLELIFVSLALLLTFPFLLICAMAIKLDTKGPVFYRQKRVGLRGGHFELIKLRTMTVNAEKNGPQWAVPDDPRITKTGKFMRLTRLDELPQLLNVLKGDMSLIGPRPERPYFTRKFINEIEGFERRLSVKPGLTGWAQVNGGYDMTPSEKLSYDLEYIRNRGYWLDFKILLKTIKVVVTGHGAR